MPLPETVGAAFRGLGIRALPPNLLATRRSLSAHFAPSFPAEGGFHSNLQAEDSTVLHLAFHPGIPLAQRPE